jgi:hypothetical protein
MNLSLLKPGQSAYDHPLYKQGLERTLAASPKTSAELARAAAQLRQSSVDTTQRPPVLDLLPQSNPSSTKSG